MKRPAKAVFLLLLAGVFAVPFGLRRISSKLESEVMNNALEGKICELDSAYGPAEIVIAGDSRAQYHLVPGIFEKSLGVGAVNIGAIPGDLITLYNAIRKYPRLLSKAKLLIISIGIYQINDGGLDYYCFSTASFANFGLLDQWGLYGTRLHALQEKYREAFRIYRRQEWKGERFCCGDYWSSEYFAVPQKGFVGIPGVWDRNLNGTLNTNPWYSGLDIHGYRWKQFRVTLRQFQDLGVPVVLYQSPYSPAWLGSPATADNASAEREFGKMMKAEAAGLRNIRFLDFYSSPNDSLSDSLFFDSAHLNTRGAGIFSRMFIARLEPEKLISSQAD
jgi:hypothetical protein